MCGASPLMGYSPIKPSTNQLGDKKMIFYNEEKNIDIDLDVKENIVVEQWNIDSSAKSATTLVGLSIFKAAEILEKQGFEKVGDIDPF